MSLLQDLASQLRGAASGLPVTDLAATADRLRGTVERLAAIRHESSRGVGVVPLGQAVEHLEHALRALLVAQEDVAAYLVAIGLTSDAVVTPPTRGRPAPARGGAATSVEREPAEVMPAWWPVRVDKITGYEAEPVAATADGSAAGDSTELLKRVVTHTGRDGLRTELRRVPAATGLGLAALAPTALHRLAAEILGHPPGPADLPALRSAAGGPVRDLLPNLDPKVGEVLLARVCRAPGPSGAPPAHPADSAIAGGVLTGVLLRRTGRGPSTLDNYLEPAHA
jgi:hypothetical protein